MFVSRWGMFVARWSKASLDITIKVTVNILTGSSTYQGTNGFFCDNIVYPGILRSRTNAFSRRGGQFCW